MTSISGASSASASEIRRQHQDSVFAEGWALYTEEMLTREGLYPDNSAAYGQVLRLSRYRAARIGVAGPAAYLRAMIESQCIFPQ